jgi:hypothetical protein
MIRNAIICALVLACSWHTVSASAHPISVTRAHVYVTRDKVAAKLDVFVEDLFLFHDLKPNDRDFLEPAVIRDGIEKHQQFLLERFAIRDVRGEPLRGVVVGVEQAEMQPEGIPLAELMAHQITFAFEYPLDEAPEFLTFSQHLVDDTLLVPAEMQLRVKQEGAGTSHHEVLYPDKPQTIRFSWDNPPLAPDASEDDWEQWYQRQEDETLGITSYSSVYSFLYIGDYEIRHEILVPLLTLEESVLIARASDAFLEVEEQDAASEQIAAFFTAGNPLDVDGVRVRPEVQRIDFYGLDFKDFARRAERRRVSMANARVGVILSYPLAAPPETVEVTWDRFNQFIWTVNMTVYAYDDTLRVALSRVGNENSYRWTSPGRTPRPPYQPVSVELPPSPRLSLPAASLISSTFLPVIFLVLWLRGAVAKSYAFATGLVVCCAVAVWPFGRFDIPDPFAVSPEITESQAEAAFAALHRNVYRAFDYRDEDQVYDALAVSVAGPLLRDMYLDIRRGLEMQEQGGAVSRVREVNMVEGEKVDTDGSRDADSPGFGFHCRWTVEGTVEHWWHVHARTNAYEALFKVEAHDGVWKITSMDILGEERLQFETRVRRS